MTIDWSPLRRELREWEGENRSLPLWWRDDDATQNTSQLDRLIALSDRLAVPVHLAVIPAHVASDLVLPPSMIPVVHGWSHSSHAPPGEKKAEFGANRPHSALTGDAKAGLSGLRTRFGPRLAPMFVPPWNRITPDLLPDLAAMGYQTMSTYGPRATGPAGIGQVNTHLDPIDWRGTRSLAAPDQLLAQLVQVLQDRRHGRTDATEPLGVLTHHLVHDTPIWTFTAAVLQELCSGPVTLWTHPQPEFPA